MRIEIVVVWDAPALCTLCDTRTPAGEVSYEVGSYRRNTHQGWGLCAKCVQRWIDAEKKLARLPITQRTAVFHETLEIQSDDSIYLFTALKRCCEVIEAA